MAAHQPYPYSPTYELFASLRRGDLVTARAALAAGADAAASSLEPALEGFERLTWPSSFMADFAPATCSMFVAAALGDCAAAVPLLLAAGAAVDLSDVNQTVDAGSPDVLAALLAAAQPRAAASGCSGLEWAEPETADPLWRVLLCARDHGLRRSGRMLEALLAAGYRPVTYALASETEGDAYWQVQ